MTPSVISSSASGSIVAPPSGVVASGVSDEVAVPRMSRAEGVTAGFDYEKFRFPTAGFPQYLRLLD